MGLFDLFSNDSAERARDAANAGARQGYADLSNMFDQGRSELKSNYGNAKNLFTDLIGKFGGGADAYADASGANGAAGLERATKNFMSSPVYGTYGFALDQGLQGLNRAHAAAGNLSSGNADADAMKFASGLAGQTYNNYLQGLSPYNQLITGATTGAASIDKGLGDTLNSSFQQQGTAANGMQTTIGNNNAGAEMNNYKTSANLWNGIMGAANLAVGALSGGLGGGSLFSGFGGGGGGSAAGGIMPTNVLPSVGQSYNLNYGGGMAVPVF